MVDNLDNTFTSYDAESGKMSLLRPNILLPRYGGYGGYVSFLTITDKNKNSTFFSIKINQNGKIKFVKNNKTIIFFREKKYFLYFLIEFFRVKMNDVCVYFHTRTNNPEDELRDVFAGFGYRGKKIYKKYRHRIDMRWVMS